MPIVSKAQARWAYANKDKKTAEGKAAADFVAAGPKGGSFKKLPASKGGYSFQRKGLPEPQASYRPGGYPGTVQNADASNSAPVPKAGKSRRFGAL